VLAPFGRDRDRALSAIHSAQARGVAAALSHLLFDYARIEGIRTLNANILATNQHMIQFARWLGMSIQSMPEDSMVLKASIDL
jgi:acetyltransferase